VKNAGRQRGVGLALQEHLGRMPWEFKFDGRRGFLELQPAFERGFHVANDAGIKLPWSLADEFGELHRLNALDVGVALLPQSRHTGQGDFVRCALKLFGDQNHAGQCQSGFDLKDVALR
jgi:hypothetical protein